MPEDSTYDLTELSDLAGVTPRTVRYYIQQGLLPSPGAPGPGAKYTPGHLARLRLIRRLQREHLPLAEIRHRLESLGEGQVRELVEHAEQMPLRPPIGKGSAAEYARRVLDAGPVARRVSSLMAAEPPTGAERSQWERIALAPDLELHVRRPLSREQNRLVDKLLAFARRLLEEDTP